MTQEEKARAYDKALKRAKTLYENANGMILKRWIEQVFPELKESEDEKVREEIVRFIQMEVEDEIVGNKWLAWLGKQKGNVGGISPNWSKEDKGIIEEVVSYLINYSNIVESKEDADRIEYLIDKIQDICPHQKQEWSKEDEPQKGLAESYLAKFDEKFPILPTLKGKQLADYKNFLNKCQQIFGLRYWGIRPIQAKLFEKLSLLWAAWGAEHLQGLGQTDGDMDNEILMWSEEDEKMLDSICISINEESIAKALRSRGDSYSIEDLKTIRSKQINWLKSLRPQNHWKPSDEQIAQLQIVIDTYGNEGICDPILTELLFQLKKLKEE